MANTEQLIAELLESGEELARSLSVHSPHFLEYLERRGRAIDALAKCDLTEEARNGLLQALEQGHAAQDILRRERSKIDSELAVLSQKKAFFQNFHPAGHQAGLDIKA